MCETKRVPIFTKMMNLLLLFLSISVLPVFSQVCLPQYEYMVNLYHESQDSTSKTKVHSFASNGIFWTGSSLDFTFHVGAKESDLIVHKAELVIVSLERLKRTLPKDMPIKVIFLLYFLRRDTNLLIFNETYKLETTKVRDISFNLTPFLRRTSLNLPRFRVSLYLYHGYERLPSRYNAKHILQTKDGCTSPFIVITTGKKQELAYVTNIIERKKRGATGFTPNAPPRTIKYQDVTPLEVPTFECQKVKFELNLADIGWDTWMIVPKVVDIGVCKGTCDDSNGLIPHALAKKKINQIMPNKDIGGICCQETHYKEIVALYHVDGSLVKSILPQFVVNSCKCR